jgi:hypothetical protein
MGTKKHKEIAKQRTEHLWHDLIMQLDVLETPLKSARFLSALRTWYIDRKPDIDHYTRQKPVSIHPWFLGYDLDLLALDQNGVSASEILGSWKKTDRAPKEVKKIVWNLWDAFECLALVRSGKFTDAMQLDYFWCKEPQSRNFALWTHHHGAYWPNGKWIGHDVEPITKWDVPAAQQHEAAAVEHTLLWGRD